VTTPSTLAARLRRLNGIALATAVGIVALFVVVSSFTMDLYQLINTQRMQARVLADNAAAALLFDDAKAAGELLRSLRHSSDIETAVLYRKGGERLSTYLREGEAAPLAPADPTVALIAGVSEVFLSEPVMTAQGEVGHLVVEVSLDSLYEQTALQIVVMILASLLAVAASRRLLRRLDGQVLQPLSELNLIMDRVSVSADYGVRAAASNVIELDQLGRGFNHMLEQIAQRDDSLHQARLVAEAASLAKGEFLATMSHEIRTPMNGVLGMNELLIGSDLRPQQRIWAETVQSSGRHLLSVINDILEFSRIESGQLELEAVDFSLAEVVDDAVLMFAQSAADKGLELVVRFTPTDLNLACCGDPFRLRQVIANLIGNAVKFTARGEIEVSVTLRQHTNAGADVRLSVRDTGMGIAAQSHDKIFEHFSQADGSTTRQFGGTGLGLAICKRLLALMGGSISVASVSGQGSTFTIELCLPPARQASAAQLSSPVLQGQRVLVVDDNRTTRDILTLQLQGWLMQVTCAESADQALRCVAEAAQDGTAFDLAVIDMRLGGQGGQPLARAIRAQPSAAGTHLLLLSSAYANADELSRQDAGALHYLNKPVRRADLLRTLTHMLARMTPLQVASVLHAEPAEPCLRGHVLLVEDNEVNQMVACQMLETLGLTAEVASSGAQAISLVQAGEFDLVLMDCQMQGMDGFEATRHIRDWERAGAQRARLPIVALTANVMSGDREACLAAGMDDYLAKPIAMARLAEMLALHLPHGERAESPDESTPQTAEPDR
jgi:signal transduction histidine kinase/DNA-binding response OmpR family regulator